MLDGLDHVWRAAEILASADAGLRGRLKAARAELLLSLRRPEQWPTDLLAVARSIERMIQGAGGDDPIDTLDDRMASQVAGDLLSLAADVALAFHQETLKADEVAEPFWRSQAEDQPVPLLEC